MHLRVEDKRRAILLRLEGRTYGEIQNSIQNLPKSTLSGWLKYIELTPETLKRLEQKSLKGRAKSRFRAAIVNRERRIQRMNATLQKAEAEIPELMKYPLFLYGLTVYWCEGTHKTSDFSFINSDPIIIKGMIKWLDEICHIPKGKLHLRLYIHKIYSGENCVEFWSKELNIPVQQFKLTYKPTPHKIKRNNDYKGCLKIRCGGVELFRKFLGWRRGVIKYLELNIVPK